MTGHADNGPLSSARLNGINVFSTCPPSSEATRGRYLDQVISVARWSEAWGCAGILVDNGSSFIDPWLVAHTIIRHTRSLCPLVAIRPAFMHPVSVAKMVATIDYMYGRRLFLNLMATVLTREPAPREASPDDKRMNQIVEYTDDPTPTDGRYERLVEYAEIVKRLLGSPAPLTYHGEFYRVDQLKLAMVHSPELFPGLFVWSAAAIGVDAASRLGATVITYPRSDHTTPTAGGVRWGIRVGILARADPGEAWQVASARFPEDRREQATRAVAAVSTARLGQPAVWTLTIDATPFWRGPFNGYYPTMCPYFVGGYDYVAAEVLKYVRMGCRTFILDFAPQAEELSHLALVFGRVADQTHSHIQV